MLLCVHCHLLQSNHDMFWLIHEVYFLNNCLFKLSEMVDLLNRRKIIFWVQYLFFCENEVSFFKRIRIDFQFIYIFLVESIYHLILLLFLFSFFLRKRVACVNDKVVLPLDFRAISFHVIKKYLFQIYLETHKFSE